ncbi:hypothetical protein BH09ACT4_BH09ACT4_03390 [soil metagenome]
MSPKDLAKQLPVTERTIRRFLRKMYPPAVPYTRWHLTDEQVRAVRARFGS